MATATAEQVKLETRPDSSYVPVEGEQSQSLPAEQPQEAVAPPGEMAMIAVDGFRARMYDRREERFDNVRIHTGRITLQRTVPLIIGPNTPAPDIKSVLRGDLLTDTRAAVAAVYNTTPAGTR